MKSPSIIILTLLALDAALTAQLPTDNLASTATALVFTAATAISCRAALGRA